MHLSLQAVSVTKAQGALYIFVLRTVSTVSSLLPSVMVVLGYDTSYIYIYIVGHRVRLLCWVVDITQTTHTHSLAAVIVMDTGHCVDINI